MKSTGEVMGIDHSFGTAFAKSQAAAYGPLPTKGRVFICIANRDKRAMIFPVKRLHDLGFEILATEGTADVLRRNGVPATVVLKYSQRAGGTKTTIVDRIHAGDVDLIVNTPFGTANNASGGGAHGRLRDSYRRGHARHPVHDHHPGPRCLRAGHRGTDPW